MMPDARIVLLVRVTQSVFAPQSIGMATWSDNVVLAPRSVGMQDWINDVVNKLGPSYVRIVKVDTEAYAGIAHLWCTYELRDTPDGKVTSRGVVSIQVVLDGKIWKIAEVSWQPQRPDGPSIPSKYLP